MRKTFNATCTPFGICAVGCLAVGFLSTTLLSAGDKQPVSSAKGARMKVEAKLASPDIIAVRVRHDMCPFCKKFDPQFPKLIRQTNESVLFVTLDLTNESTQQQAALLVGALGLKKLWPGDMSQMGTITFVDGTSKEIISSMHMVGTKEVKAALNEAVAAVR